MLPSCSNNKPINVMEKNYTEELLKLHNGLRKKHLKPMLATNSKLMIAAQKHADWMAEHKNLSHTGVDRSEPWDRAEKEGYVIARCGENIASGEKDMAEVFKAWTKSWGHRTNILNSKYEECGFGMATDADGTPYWCVLFATPEII